MPFVLTLAHGALGSFDELLPVVAIGILAAVLVFVGFRSRNEQEDEADAQTPPTEQDSGEHYRLD
jgi:hypothetical protein